MKKIVFLFLIFFGSQVYYCQLSSQNYLSLELVFGNDSLVLESKEYALSKDHRLRFQVLKFYLSGIEFYKQDKLVWKEKTGFYLVDAAQQGSLKIAINKPNELTFTRIKFNLGVDSLTNLSGVMGRDLDPTKGMYWTWQSGYIHFKLEGTSSISKHPKKEIQFHLGGYKEPYNTFQTLSVETKQKKLVFDVKTFIAQLDLSKQDHLMLPGMEAKRLSELLTKCFSAAIP